MTLTCYYTLPRKKINPGTHIGVPGSVLIFIPFLFPSSWELRSAGEADRLIPTLEIHLLEFKQRHPEELFHHLVIGFTRLVDDEGVEGERDFRPITPHSFRFITDNLLVLPLWFLADDDTFSVDKPATIRRQPFIHQAGRVLVDIHTPDFALEVDDVDFPRESVGPADLVDATRKRRLFRKFGLHVVRGSLVVGVRLVRRREDGLQERAHQPETRRKVEFVGIGNPLFVELGPETAGHPSSENELDRNDLAHVHDDRPQVQIGRIVRTLTREILVDLEAEGRDMVRDVLKWPEHPRDLHRGEDLSLVGDRAQMDDVVRADSVRSHHEVENRALRLLPQNGDIVLGKLVQITNLPLMNQIEVLDVGFAIYDVCHDDKPLFCLWR